MEQGMKCNDLITVHPLDQKQVKGGAVAFTTTTTNNNNYYYYFYYYYNNELLNIL